MMIALDRIADDPGHLRRLAPTPEQDEALVASIRAIGVVQPVLVRPEGEGFVIVAGRRRLQAARAIGLAEIPAEIREFHNGHAAAAEAAENMVRAAMAPLDQWRAIVALQERGFTLDQAALALGLHERLARRLDKLGRLHPAMIGAIEKHGIPHQRFLVTIANAPHDVQKKALPKKGELHWGDVAQRCAVTRIPRARAIFDVETSRVAFDEDLFAEPGSDGQFTTADVRGFLTAQRAALAEEIKAAHARKERIELVELNGYDVTVPKGYRVEYGAAIKPCSQKSGRLQLVGICPDGYRLGEVKRAIAVPVRAEKKAAAKRAGDAASDTGPAGDNAAAIEAPKVPITKAGLELLARAKTQALQETLRDGAIVTETLLVCFLLATHARNVQISSGARDGYGQSRYRNTDLVARLVGPGGDLIHPDDDTLRQLAGEALARMIEVSGPDATSFRPGSGAVAEWIGAALDAAAKLPRLDTPELLATINGDALRRAAEGAGIKPLKGVKALREQLAGNLPDWHPDAAQFGAPGPKEHVPADNDSTAEEAA
jgi:ParB family chromosome partitioning protein